MPDVADIASGLLDRFGRRREELYEGALRWWGKPASGVPVGPFVLLRPIVHDEPRGRRYWEILVGDQKMTIAEGQIVMWSRGVEEG